MIVVKVELWPYGREQDKELIAEAKISNTLTGDSLFGNYRYEFNQSNSEESNKGFFFGHERKQSVWKLISSCLNKAFNPPSTP